MIYYVWFPRNRRAPSRAKAWNGIVQEATPALKSFVGKEVQDMIGWLSDRHIYWEVSP